MKILKKVSILPLCMVPGDKIVLTYKDEDGRERTLLETDISEEVTFDTAMAVEVTDELGLEYGIGGIFGKSKEERP